MKYYALAILVITHQSKYLESQIILNIQYLQSLKTTFHYIRKESAQINKYGSSEVIEINQSTPEPIVSSGLFLVIIKADGVNQADWKIGEGACNK